MKELTSTKNKIEIIFDSLDLEQAQMFARGIQHCFLKYGEDKNYAWNEFKGFTTSLS